MEYIVKINIKEVVEFSSTNEDRKDLIKFIYFDCLTKDERKEYLTWMMNDVLEAEVEFDNRDHVKKAIETIIKIIE